MKKTILLPLLSFLYLFTSGIKGQENSENNIIRTDAPSLYMEITASIQKAIKQRDDRLLSTISLKTDRILSGSITDTSRNNLDELFEFTDKITSESNPLPVYSSVTGNYLPEISYNEFSFRMLNAVMRHMEMLFHGLSSAQKLMNIPVFSTSSLDISQLKTRLFSRMLWILTSCEKKEERLRGWLAIRRMLSETDIKRSESDRAFQNSSSGIITEEGEIMKKLKTLSGNEYYEDVRLYSAKVTAEADTMRPKYKAYTTIISLEELEGYSPLHQRVNKRAIDLFEEASNSPDQSEKLRLFTRAIEADSAFTAAYNNRAIIRYQMGNYTGAEKDFNTVIRLDPGYFGAYKYLGYINFKSGRLELAAENFSRALEYDLSDTLLINRGLCYRGLMQFEKAIRDFSSAIRLNTRSPNAYYNRVQCYLALKRYKEAEDDYLSLINLQPENSSNHYNLGCIYSIQQEWQKVVDIWEKGLKVNPRDPNILKNLPQARAAAGKERNREK